ncbi:MAG: cysteine synthase family protein [Bacteroidia bacterium]|nr:cysteine synthase family protein [Bacteroidia bacterium]
MSTLLSPSPSILENLDQTGNYIGNTPLLEIRHAFSKPGVQIFAKLEWFQLGQSVKARAAYEIIKNAIFSGELTPEKALLDATSGNTGIAYAAICARLGIRLTICLPLNASPERKRLLKAYGAELILTSPLEGTDGAQEKARELFALHPEKYFYADQYNNQNNWKAHYYGTAKEIYHQTGGRITHFVAAMGTTGTFIGTGRKLREINADIRRVALQPETALHGLEGWKDLETARVPGIYDPAVHHEVRHVSTGDAYHWLKTFALKEGILLSPSAAANFAGAVSVANEIDSGVIVTVFPDDASKYQEIIEEIL